MYYDIDRKNHYQSGYENQEHLLRIVITKVLKQNCGHTIVIIVLEISINVTSFTITKTTLVTDVTMTPERMLTTFPDRLIVRDAIRLTISQDNTVDFCTSAVFLN